MDKLAKKIRLESVLQKNKNQYISEVESLEKVLFQIKQLEFEKNSILEYVNEFKKNIEDVEQALKELEV